MEVSRSPWNNGLIDIKILPKLENQDKMGLCRIMVSARSSYEIMSFIIDYANQTYFHTSCYSCLPNVVPERLFTSKKRPISLDSYRSSKSTIDTYSLNQHNSKVDLDIITLSKVLSLTIKENSIIKEKIRNYILSLPIETIPQIFHTHSILEMNIFIIKELDPIVNDEAKRELSVEKYIKEISEMKEYLVGYKL